MNKDELEIERAKFLAAKKYLYYLWLIFPQEEFTNNECALGFILAQQEDIQAEIKKRIDEEKRTEAHKIK